MPITRKALSSLKQLKVQLEDLRSSFDDISGFIQKFSDATTATQVDVRLERIDDLWERFSENLVELRSHEEFEDEENQLGKLRKQMSDRYYEAKTFLLDKSKALHAPPAVDQSLLEQPAANVVDHVRLPQINLQTFSGDIDEWLSFRDLFTSLIHWRTDLPEVEKLHYLKGCLQGEPKSLIDPLKITKANYQIAWETLMKRYNNNKLLMKKQVQSFFMLPTFGRESVVDLRSLVEGFERIVQTLDQVVEPVDYKDLLQADSKVTHPQQTTTKSRVSTTKASYNSVEASSGRCVACKDSHHLFQCSVFQKLSVADKDAMLKSHGLCRNCFRPGHQAKDCLSKFRCRICRRRHHTLVCFKSEKGNTASVAEAAGGSHPSNSKDSQGSSGSSSIQVVNMAATDVSVSGAANQVTSQVLLATAVVIVEDDFGVKYHARALLDSGSESNFVSERLVQRMKVVRKKIDVSVLGIGQGITKVKHMVQAAIRSRISDFSRDMRFLVLSKVTANLPTTSINTERWVLPKGIELADPAFFTSKEVDIVLGIEAFFEFFKSGRRITIGKNLPSLTDSVFGWVVCGGCSIPSESLQINCHFSTSKDLEKLMARFWSCEEVEFSDTCSLEEKKCEEIFQRGVQRNDRVVVTLFHYLKKRTFFQTWTGKGRSLAFMDEYLKLGHMSKVEEATVDKVKRCFLPHHPVVKEASTTTKVRVVFDASCKTSEVFLNDVLLVGPVVHDDLRSIILRSRTKQVLLVLDEEKMFRQILPRPTDRPLQSILFRFAPEEEVAVYELNTVTYGTKPAPFLATRTLQQLAADEADRFPLAARAIREDVYMDDVITGTDEVELAVSTRNQLTEMMQCGGFKLRKWACNVPEVLDCVPEENLAIREPTGIILDPEQSVKTLGLTWIPHTDTLRFQFAVPPIEPGVPLTKRQILSQIATLFDPLGLIGATTSSAKIFMQQLWTLEDGKGNRLDWDQPVPSMALQRFVSRRGRDSDIYSDNGTNFVGARNKLTELQGLMKDRIHRERITSEMAKDGIQWHFNPPSAPHFGGLWEAAVRSTKNHLMKVIGENPVSAEDFSTLLTQVEACLNSRPLTPMSDDPNDLEPLTPAHFLIGSSLQALPDPALTSIPANRLNHYQLMQQKLQNFWIRWRREYLSQLQARAKRWKPAVPVDVGKLVVVKDDNLPPMRWKLARIIAVHPGKDKIVRVVTLKTACGELKRPVEKICILPLPSTHSEEDKTML
ncbi:uncharacterized protein LOC134223013 [Armigeres subalbatus]|uniref:uncharacterized protein LOC134223013 n=1 Tax=Armigeres subalbatus TaxID=124917 RepID=UPI002ED011CC